MYKRQGKVVVLVIDVHGAANIRRMFPGATTVFLLPPSVEEPVSYTHLDVYKRQALSAANADVCIMAEGAELFFTAPFTSAAKGLSLIHI